VVAAVARDLDDEGKLLSIPFQTGFSKKLV